ncbi:unnamed protein product, partial [Effrenium voratum]
VGVRSRDALPACRAFEPGQLLPVPRPALERLAGHPPDGTGAAPVQADGVGELRDHRRVRLPLGRSGIHQTSPGGRQHLAQGHADSLQPKGGHVSSLVPAGLPLRATAAGPSE